MAASALLALFVGGVVVTLVAADVRLTDAAGGAASTGLLQVRTDIGFGSVCGLNQAAAKVACRQMGFRLGVAATSPCSSYGGANLCGAPGTPVAKKNVRCQGGEMTLDACAWEPADSECADHSQDAIVYCSNTRAGDLVKDGSARLLSHNGSPSLSGAGRLEVFHAGAWSPVCSAGWTAGSASVACKQMGFDGAAATAAGDCENFEGHDACGSSLPAISNLACGGSESNLLECGFEAGDDVFCAQEESLVIACAGDGDTQGRPAKQQAAASLLQTRPGAIRRLRQA